MLNTDGLLAPQHAAGAKLTFATLFEAVAAELCEQGRRPCPGLTEGEGLRERRDVPHASPPSPKSC